MIWTYCEASIREVGRFGRVEVESNVDKGGTKVRRCELCNAKMLVVLDIARFDFIQGWKGIIETVA